MLMIAVTLFLFLAAFTQETKPVVPADSVEVRTQGCLKGRVLTATPRPEGEGVMLGPDVTGRRFRVSGPRDVMSQVNTYDRNLVEVTGIIKKSALIGSAGGRVTMSGSGSDPNRMGMGTPTGSLQVMDLTAVRYLSDVCPSQ
jgi:hypothetical protein